MKMFLGTNPSGSVIKPKTQIQVNKRTASDLNPIKYLKEKCLKEHLRLYRRLSGYPCYLLLYIHLHVLEIGSPLP